MERKSKLKPRRIKFIQEYLKDFDQTAAAIRAGYSAHSARFIGSQLMVNPEVKKEYEIRYAEYKKKYEIRRESIIEKLNKLIDECESDGDRKYLVASLEMLNKMSGNYSHTVITQTAEQPLFPE